MKYVFLLILAGVLLAGFGCPGPEENGGPAVCTDMDCFIGAGEKCSPAVMNYSASVDVLGVVSTAKTFMEIRGLEDGKCVYYQRTDGIDAEFSEEFKGTLRYSGKSESEIADMEAAAAVEAQKAVGTVATCKMETSKLAEILKKWKSGPYSTKDLGAEECVINYPPGFGGEEPPEEIPGEEEITNCDDGTFVGNCSVNKPKICDIFGNLVDDAETCGCPPKSLKAGRECIYACSDQTPLEECSENRPAYCNENAKLENRSSLCGCPEGYDPYNENCRNTCNDTTLKFNCSVKNKPLYCNENYELVKNPPKCGCYEWEMFENNACFDPASKMYSEDETVRINKDVSLMVYDFEELGCGTNAYVRAILTVTNNGETPYFMDNQSFRMKRGNAGLIMERPSGCSAGSTFTWGNVRPGETRKGNVWFLVYGGAGDFYIEYDVPYTTVLKVFKIDMKE